MFVDRVELFVSGGNGGRGMSSFRREKYIPRGGPDGGDGGDGGSVIIRADPNADNLAPLLHKRHWKAKNGEPGGTSGCAGKDAHDLVILVPPGTLIRDRERGNVLKDLVEPGDELVIAGGRGGRGNMHFASAINRTPREFEPGEEGEERWIKLELKVIADAGLVGFPNAGKSTLLSRLSRATPEIADYPFTTKHPNLGIVTMGHEFLRHVDRTRVIIHMVEPFPSDGSDAVKNYHTIRNELKTYSEELAAKPEIVCVSKAELTDAATVRDALAEELGKEVLLISGVTGEGLSKLVGKANELIVEQRRLDREAKDKTKPVQFATEKAIRETEATEETP